MSDYHALPGAAPRQPNDMDEDVSVAALGLEAMINARKYKWKIFTDHPRWKERGDTSEDVDQVTGLIEVNTPNDEIYMDLCVQKGRPATKKHPRTGEPMDWFEPKTGKSPSGEPILGDRMAAAHKMILTHNILGFSDDDMAPLRRQYAELIEEERAIKQRETEHLQKRNEQQAARAAAATDPDRAFITRIAQVLAGLGVKPQKGS